MGSRRDAVRALSSAALAAAIPAWRTASVRSVDGLLAIG